MDQASIAESLREIAALLELGGENRYKVRAFERGARAVEATRMLDRLIAEGRVTDLPGVGTTLGAQIEELYRTGTSALLTSLRGGRPPSALERARARSRSKRADGDGLDLAAELADEIREGTTVGDADLVARRDLRGFVHCHTTWSDGKDDIETMARAAKERGAEFITITDHSPNASYAGGLDLDRLRRQWDAIAAAEESVGIRILKGTEADILADGALDWPDAVLERLDVVIASVHNRYKQDEAAMTARLLRAMRHPVFKIWGHPLGRLVPSRPPIACRVEEILDALAASRGAIEINGDPHRLDLEPRWCREARARGLPFVLSVDAHSTRNLEYVDYAVGLARRAGLRRDDVLNTLPAGSFAEAVRP